MLPVVEPSNVLLCGIRRGFRQIARDRTWGATLLLLTALMLLMQLLVVFLLGIEGMNRTLTSRAALTIEVLPSAQQQDIQELNAALRGEAYVSDVAFATREQALEREKKRDPELVQFLEEFKIDNPFPDTFSITLTSLDYYTAFQAFVEQDRWKSVVNPSFLSSATDQERQMQTLLQVTGTVRMLVSVFVVIAFIVLCFVVLEWVTRSLARRARELLLEKMLGAPPLGILLPLVTEMASLLLLSLFLGTAIIALLVVMLPTLLPALALEDVFVELQGQVVLLLKTVVPWILPIEFLMMPVLALGGALLGERASFGRGRFLSL